MPGANDPSGPAAPAGVGLQLDREILVEGIARGVERALGAVAREEVRAFLEDYFGCLDKPEIAAYLGCSERTVEQLWADQKIAKDTALGDRMPRGSLSDLKELLRASRIKSRAVRPKPLKIAA